MRGWLGFLVGAGAACAIGALLLVLIEAQTAPWARSLTGAPTLTGEWVGAMTTPTGARRLVWLKIGHDVPSAACFGCPSLGGSASTCDPGGQVRHYEIWGDVENPRGTPFQLKARETAESDVRLGDLEGAWSGDAIGLTTTLVAPNYPTTTRWERSDAGVETTTVTGGHPDTRAPISFALTRGALRDFEVRCRSGSS